MVMMDKNLAQQGLDKFNKDLAASGKTLEEFEADKKAEAAAKMDSIHKDPKFNKIWEDD